MAGVSDQLRRAREARGFSIQQVVDRTNLKADQVTALEEGRWGEFAAPVYVRGFVRSYATVLKLPVGPALDQLNVELGIGGPAAEQAEGFSPRKGVVDTIMLWFSRINWRLALPTIIFLLVTTGAYFGYRWWQERQTRDPLAGYTPPTATGVTDLDTLPLTPPAPPR